MKKILASGLCLLLPTVSWVLAARIFTEPLIFMYAVAIIYIIAFHIFKPCSPAILLFGFGMPPIVFLAWGMINEYIEFGSFPETFMYGVPFALIFFVWYSLPCMIIYAIIGAIVKIKS